MTFIRTSIQRRGRLLRNVNSNANRKCSQSVRNQRKRRFHSQGRVRDIFHTGGVLTSTPMTPSSGIIFNFRPQASTL